MFALFLFQILMFGLFTAVIGKEFIVASVILLLGEISKLSLIFFSVSIIIFRYVQQSSDLLITKNQENQEGAITFRMPTGRDINSKNFYLHPYEQYERT